MERLILNIGCRSWPSSGQSCSECHQSSDLQPGATLRRRLGRGAEASSRPRKVDHGIPKTGWIRSRAWQQALCMTLWAIPIIEAVKALPYPEDSTTAVGKTEMLTTFRETRPPWQQLNPSRRRILYGVFQAHHIQSSCSFNDSIRAYLKFTKTLSEQRAH